MNLKKPYVVGIAGESGVGKSTITEIIRLFYGVEKTVTLSTDDLHKWERVDPNWDIYTHLNPEANNLELGDIQLRDLVEGRSIYRTKYNHNTGVFKAPVKIIPKEVIINQGLHAFYTEEAQQLTDLKIFIKTDETLRTHWKIIRDTEKRGYKYSTVIDTIKRREPDALKINAKQIAAADIIINITPDTPIQNVGDKNETVNVSLSYTFIQPVVSSLFSFIIKYNKDMKDFLELCSTFGVDTALSQHTGGNISVKTGEYMIIKASGCKMKDVSRADGYSNVRSKLLTGIKDPEDYDRLFESDMFYTGKRPSMESGIHSLLQKYTIHLHPVYLTTILCFNNSEEVIKELYKEYTYLYLPYITPGYSLFKALQGVKNIPKIIFLQNHGLIITSDKKEEVVRLTQEVVKKAEDYLKPHKEFSIDLAEKQPSKEYYFPDAVIYLDKKQNREVLAFNNYIADVTEIFQSRHVLSNKDMLELLELESEKYRKNL